MHTIPLLKHTRSCLWNEYLEIFGLWTAYLVLFVIILHPCFDQFVELLDATLWRSFFLRFCRAQVSQSRIILGCGRARRIWGKNESLEKLQGARLEKSWSKSWNTQEPGGQKLSLLTGFLILLMIEWFSLPEWFKEVWGMELLNVISWIMGWKFGKMSDLIDCISRMGQIKYPLELIWCTSLEKHSKIVPREHALYTEHSEW